MRETARLAAIAGLALTGCVANTGPIIDTQGVNMARYEQDLAQCSVYQDQVSIPTGMVKGAAAGGVTGAATGVFTGDVGRAAGVGAVLGSAQSARENDRIRQRVVKNCLRGRGYRVLN